MQSDSDSDGSHISATPPRDPTPPPKYLPQKFISKFKQKQTQKPTKPPQKPNSKPSNYPQKPPQIQNPLHESSNSTLLPSFPLPIQRSTTKISDISGPNSIRAGSCSFSKSNSFSKFQRASLNFDFSEKDPILPSGSVSKPESEVIPEGEGSLKKRVVRKPSNLIGCGSRSESNSNVLPAKRIRGGNEGNFVKLNINGHGRRFTFKGKNRNFSSSSRRSYYKRSKRNFGAKNGVEGNGVCDEEGLILEDNGKQMKWEDKMSKDEVDLIKEAVLDVRNEASDDNLSKLLKLTHGYDSFRDGQLEAIKMVLAGKSTMLVLPTGAGKSLCYQLPAIVFPGITLVVSPLMALMIDQLKQLPPVVNGALLSSSQVDFTPHFANLFILF